MQCRGVEDEACRQVQLPCRGAGSLPRQDRTYPAPARARPPPRARSSAALRGESLCSLPPCMGLAAVSRGGGRAGRGTHGAASCCLRRSPVHACMAALQRGWVPSSGSAGGAYIPQSETCRWCDSCMVVSHQAMSWFGLSWVVVVLLDECAAWWR